MSRSAHHSLPLYKLLKKGKDFAWLDECEAAFQHLNAYSRFSSDPEQAWPKREISEHEISYQPRQAIKAYVLSDFVVEMTGSQGPLSTTWETHIDGSSNVKGSGIDIILDNDDGLVIEQSLCFGFPTFNNQAECEAYLAELSTTKDLM